MIAPAKVGHICVLCDGVREQKTTTLSYISAGLANGEQCVYVTDENSVEEWRTALLIHGVDVTRESERGALRIVASWSSSHPGEYNSVELARRLWGRIQNGVTEFGHVRYVVDMATSLGAGNPASQHCHWEATLNPLIEDAPVEILCLYDRHGLSEGVIKSALRTHPLVALAGARFENPNFQGQRILEEESCAGGVEYESTTTEGMLSLLTPLDKVHG